MKQIYFFLAIFLYCAGGLWAQQPNMIINRGINPQTGAPLQKRAPLKSSAASYLTTSGEYQAVDVFPEYDTFSAFDLKENTLYGNEGNTIVALDLLSGELISETDKPADYAGWPSFLNVDPSHDFLWAGYTNNGNTDDRIYKIDLTTGEWLHVASSSGNFDLAYRQGQALFTGLNSSNWEDPTSVFILDESGNNQHQKLIEVGGSSAGLATDAEGNVYYGTYFLYTSDPNALYRWNSDLIDDAIENNYVLSIEDADKLTDLPEGAYDCQVDDAGNVLFTCNNFSSDKLIAKWNGTEGDGHNYEAMAYATDGMDWLTMVKTQGDLTNYEAGNSAFVLGFGRPIAKVSKVAPPSPFISEVLEYKPAPGQFINKTPWGTPESGASLVGGIQGSMSLGAFGGYVVFRFEDAVKNHPDNPYGIDFTLFGNPLQTWSEPATVWVMKDENQNGLPDDTWYELAGSDYWFSTTQKNYEVTYRNPGGTVAVDVPWTDNHGESGSVLANAFHKQPYYPQPEIFSNVAPESYTLSGTLIEGALDMRKSNYIMSYQRGFGYADNQPRGQAPWTTPDNPYVPTIENAGGDGFDISWAVDGEGNYVDLDEVHFIKVVAAMQNNAGWLGEVSTEITGAAMVQPNPDLTGELDMIVIKELPYTISTPTLQLEAFAFHSGRLDRDREILWTSNIDGVFVDENMVLHLVPGSEELTLTARLADKPSVTTSLTAQTEVLATSVHQPTGGLALRVFPNPASEYFVISGSGQTELTLYTVTGQLVYHTKNHTPGQKVNIGHLDNGFYLLVVKDKHASSTFRLIKQ